VFDGVKAMYSDRYTESGDQGYGSCGIPPLAKNAKDGAPGEGSCRH